MSLRLSNVISSKDNNFDFIRFCAAVLVIFSHSFQLSGLHDKDPLMLLSKKYLSLGTFSVTIFFVISGFLITRSYAKARSLKAYIFARILRIYPALIATVLVTVFILGPLLTKDSMYQYFTGRETGLYLLNCFSQRIYIHLPGVFKDNFITVVNGPLWSLPYELTCYVLIIFLGQLIEKKLINAIFFLVIIMAMCFFIDIAEWKNILKLMFFFICGASFYIFRNRIVLNHFVAVIFIFILLLSMYFNFHRYLKDLITGITLPYIIITFSYTKSSLNHFAKYGDFSYGLYVIAWPIQQIVVQFFPTFTQYQNFIISFVAALILSYGSWHLIEKRFLKYKICFK